METVVDNQVEVELQELRTEAEELGIVVHPKAKAETLQKKIDDKRAEIAEKQEAKKKAKEKAKEVKKVKVIINPRNGDDKIADQYFGLNGGGIKESILVKFDEEVSISEPMLAHIKSKGCYVHKVKKVIDEDGIPQNKWHKKWESRFIVEKID